MMVCRLACRRIVGLNTSFKVCSSGLLATTKRQGKEMSLLVGVQYQDDPFICRNRAFYQKITCPP